MANRAVLLTGAVAAGLYWASETQKESRCRQEEEEERQKIQDRLEEIERRKEQDQRCPNLKGQNDTTEDAIAFYHAAEKQRREHLLGLLEKLHKTATRQMPSRLYGVYLPLLDTNENSPDEVVFGAALALGDERLLEMVFERELIQPSPSLALTKLSPSSIKFILDAFKGTLGSRRALPFAENVAIADIEVDSILSLLHQSDFTSAMGRPLVLALNAPSKPSHAVALHKCARELDLFLYPESAFQVKVDVDQWVVFYKLQRRRAKKDISRAKSRERLLLTNFAGDFKVPIDRIEGNHSVAWSLNRILDIQKSALMSQAGNTRDAAARLLASLSSYFFAEQAGNRFKVFQSSEVSVEHVAVASGMEGTLLSDMRNGILSMLDQNRERIMSTLSAQLKQCIPSPDDCDDPVAVLDAEISTFVQGYARLLELSYCIVPLLEDKPPSELVPKSGVTGDAMNFMFEPFPFASRRIQRRLELEERERLIRSRHLVSPPTYVSVICIALIWALFHWLSFACLRNVLGWKCLSKFLSTSTYQVLLHGGALFFGGWTLLSFLELLKHPLQVPSTETPLFTAQALAEASFRKWHDWRGRETPFFEEMNRLTELCRKQYRKWLKRCAKRDFHEALRRKKITGKSLAGLLTTFAESVRDNSETDGLDATKGQSSKDSKADDDFAEADATKGQSSKDSKADDDFFEVDATKGQSSKDSKGGDDFIEGVLPGSLEEAEAFLDIEVVQESGNKEIQSFNEVFAALADEVTGLTQEFPVGATVEIAVDFSSQRSPPVSSTTGDTDALVSSRRLLASVVGFYPGVVTVQFDGGEHEPLHIPSGLCTLIDDENKTGPKKGEEGEILDDEIPMMLPFDKDGDQASDEQTVPVEEEALIEQESKEEHFERAFTVKDALIQGGWTLKRAKKHIIYKRKVISPEDGSEQVQSFAMASSPSDRRASKNALATLNRLNRAVAPAHSGKATSAQECVLCKELKGEWGFSSNQWKSGKYKCKDCIASMQ